jgi:serine phosphatase RsbU (regulator of sigma subunit)
MRKPALEGAFEGRSTRPEPPPVFPDGDLNARDGPVVRALLGLLARQSVPARVGVVAGLFAVIACVDIVTNPGLSFLAFYFFPVLLASWFLGRGEGVVVALASVAVWTWDDALSHRHYAHTMIPIWNRTIEFAFFLFLSWLTGALKIALEDQIRARARRLEQDLAIAHDVQAALLPPRRRNGPGFTAAAECLQVFGVGGDAYDFIGLPGGALGVAILDVAGKGMPAALLMASFLASLRSLLPARADRLGALAGELSEILRSVVGPSRFVTAFIGVVEKDALRYVNAGHEAGLLFRPGDGAGEAERLPSTGSVLGLLPGSRFREERVSFPPGGLLVLFTDGLTECSNAAGGEFGARRVAQVAGSVADAAPERVVDRLLRAAETHAAGRAFTDDVTVLCVRRAPGIV